MDNNYLINIQTVQANAIRILIESLKDILNDVNIIFLQDSIKITSMDGSKNAIVFLKLDKEKFENYDVKEKFIAGVNMISFFKIIKSMKNSDSIRFFVNSDNLTKLNVEIENREKKTIIQSSLKLLDIDDNILEIPDIKFDCVYNMPSNDFQSHMRDLSIITSTVSISSNNGKIIFNGSGDFADRTINVGECNSDALVNLNANGHFNIKYLLLFTKSTNLCTTVEIYLKNNYPLVLVYNVANLGKLKYILSPLVDEN